MTFESLLTLLPHCPGTTQLPITASDEGFKYVTVGLPEFVGPDVLASTVIEQPESPNVLILSAAGAVGKSTLARQIAFLKKSPYWDLALAPPVGGNSLTGHITTSFGFTGAAAVSENLSKGRLFLVIDALDEARVKSNEAGFESFIKNVGQIAKGTPHLGIVLLARTQTAETTWLILDSLSIRASLLSIQPFTEAQAAQYIESRIQHLDAAAATRIRTHSEPFYEARDLILQQLTQAVSSGPQENKTDREFLGYAPVLETVAILLANEGNYKEFVSSIQSLGKEGRPPPNRPLAILEHVVTRLLQREQSQKLQKNIRPALESVAKESGWSDWGSLYSPEEQIWRLLGLLLKRDFHAGPPMPASVRARYEDQLKSWLPEHPFLREGTQPANKVFESFLFATALREYLTIPGQLVEEKVSDAAYKPSRLLADFYMRLGEKTGNMSIAERHLGFLYDSLLAGETDALRIRLSIDLGDPDDDDDGLSSEGEFELIYHGGAGPGVERIESRVFTIIDQKGQVTFRRQLKDADIVSRGSISLGGIADDFEIGPAVDIRCAAIRFMSPGLIVRTTTAKATEADAVVIDANASESLLTRKPVVRGELWVRWPGSDAYPWTDHALKSSDDGLGPEMHEVYLRFRRIACSLRSHSKGSLARFREKVEHRRVLKNDVGRALLKSLLKDKILRLDGDFYHWVPDNAASLLAVTWLDLRNRTITSDLRTYFVRFIAEHKELF